MKAILLLSGGFDSPVAGYLLNKKNIELIALFFSLEPFTDEQAEEKANKLSEKIGCTKFLVVKNGLQHKEIIEKCNNRYYYVLTRRLMYRIAEKLAEKYACDFIATGENLGQVGSQTLANMNVIDNAVKIKVIRPLLCNDKVETINLAREIGTYEISKGPEVCCVLAPKNPVTGTTVKRIEKEEENLDIPKMVNEALEMVK